MTIEDFDLSDYGYVPIKRIYDEWWIILAQNEQDYQNKVNRIRRGDRKGFLTIDKVKRNKIMINKITRENAKELGLDFNELINNMEEVSYEEHRRGSNFFTRSIVVINEKYNPDVNRELDGFWETNTYVSDSDWGHELSDITELNRVVRKEKVITETYWENVEN